MPFGSSEEIAGLMEDVERLEVVLKQINEVAKEGKNNKYLLHCRIRIVKIRVIIYVSFK